MIGIRADLINMLRNRPKDDGIKEISTLFLNAREIGYEAVCAVKPLFPMTEILRNKGFHTEGKDYCKSTR